MLDIRFVRENPDAVKENIRKKFQDAKLPLVDEVIALDAEYRAAIGEASDLRANRNKLSKQIGALMGQAKKDPSKAAEAEEIKKQVTAQADRLKELEAKETELQAKIQEIMYTIPQMIDPSVPIGPDDSHNVEVQRFGEPVVPDYPIPYHVDIMESFDGIDLDAAGRVSGNGFYYLLGDIARLHEAVLAYARDFMIDKGFTYVIPPFMMHGDVVKGVMSFPEMDAMMYKIEGEDLYLIGTSEHTMIGRFIDQTLDGAKLPLTLTSYSPCFRKEKGAHGIEERGIYRIHQFEKQEMIVVCKPEDSMDWYDKLWKNSVELFRSMEIPVRQLECCSGDLADLKVKSCDIEAWSPRQQKYFEVCSCSNLGDAQARRLHIRFKDENGKTQLAHTLNNTCVAPPRMLIAFLENHLQADGTVTIPEVLRPYMGGKAVLVPAQAVFLFCNLDEQSLFLAGGSTGLASGNTEAEARLAALTEIVERDAEATTPFSREGCFVLKSRDERLQALLDDYAARGIQIQFQDITTELGVPVYRCFVMSRRGEVAQATGANLCGSRAALAALTEVPWPYPYGEPTGPALGGLPVRWLEDLPDYSLPSAEASCKLLEKTLCAQGRTPLYVDISRKDLDMPVVRALVPGLELTADFDRFSRPSLRLLARYTARWQK
mgnify:CR=1 FL=1